MRKYASLEVLEAWRQPRSGGITRTAHRVAFDYEPRQGYLYVRSRMISSRTNDNHDTFPAGEIEKGYQTFLGKPVFVNHHNANHRRARGVIVAVALHRDRNLDGSPDTWVEGLMEVDAVKFPRLAKAILAKRVNRTSMGVDVEWSRCSACGNKATSPAEYCKHLPAMKGKKIRQRNQVTGKVEEKLIHEVCAGLSFFENSLLVEDPADPTAYLLGKPDARGLGKTAGALAGDPDFRDHLGNTCRDCGDPVKYNKSPRALAPYKHDSMRTYDHQARALDQNDRSGGLFPSTFGGTRCLSCGEDVKVNLRALDRNGGWHHGDGMKRDHDATPLDAQKVYDSIPGVRAQFDQVKQQVGDHLHSQFEQMSGHPLPRRARGDEGQMPPDPFTASRREPSPGGKKARYPKPVRGRSRDPRYDGVSLKQDRNGFYVHTHRSRSESHPTPEDIPDADIDYIRSTGARAPGGAHPWFSAHPVSKDNITAAYHDTTGDEKALGDRWYSDAHHVAKAIAGGDAAVGAGLLSAYSPQTAWPVNMFNASRAANGDPPGPGTGAMGSQQKPALRILAGEHHSQVLKAPKTSAFAHLIEHGGDSPEDEAQGKSRVVIDRHAMSVAAGRRLSKEESGGAPLSQPQHYEHVEQLYRDAARDITEAVGRKVSPHQVQAATWLRQIRKNTEADSSGVNGGGGKGRVKMQDNSRARWTDHHHEHHPGQIDPENMHYHGALYEGGSRCAGCGGQFAGQGSEGKARSKVLPFLCPGCAAAHAQGPDTQMNSANTAPGRNRDVYEGGGRYRKYHPDDHSRQSLSSRTAYGETRVPPQVDTLRMDECPVCGEHNVWSGSRCPVCGFVVPPSVFRDPDTSKASGVRDQLDSGGDVTLPPGSPDAAQPDSQGLPPVAQAGSGDDADEQMVHPDQLTPDGVPAVQGGGDADFDAQDDAMIPPGEEDPALAGGQEPLPEEAPPPGEDPDGEMYAEELECPACGTTFEADAAAQPGVPCPACGMAALHPADEDPGAVPPEGAEDPSDPGEQPGDEQDEEDEEQDMPESKTAAAVARAQAHRIAELSARNEVLETQIRFLASAAGVEGQFAEINRRVMQRHADILNPASPVPDPPEGPPTETTEQALMPESTDNAGRPGTTPGANSRVPAQQTTTAITPGVEIQTPPATNLVDVTAPVQGTNPSQDGGVPLQQRRIETDVRIDPDPLKASGPGIGGQGDNGAAFPWILDAQQGGQQEKTSALRGDDSSRRTFASIRLARLRVQAGLAQGDELSVAERIERDAALATPVIEHEIGVLSQMPLAQPRQAARPVQRTAARSVPSLASVGASSQYAPAAADDLDASDLFD